MARGNHRHETSHDDHEGAAADRPASVVATEPWPPSQAWAIVRLFLGTTLVLLGGGAAVVVVLPMLLAPLGVVGWVLMVVLLSAAFILWFGWLMRRGTRAATIPPRPGLEPAALGELLDRLDALDSTGWVHVEGGHDSRRRVSAHGPVETTESVGTGGWQRESERVVSGYELTLDESRHRAVATERIVTTKTGVAVTLASASAFWERAWFRGITMPTYDPDDPPALDYDPETTWQVRTRVGLTPKDLRSALVDVVCGSGWTYVPSFTVGRWSSAPMSTPDAGGAHDG